MTDTTTTAAAPGTLAPIQPGENAFRETQDANKPAAPVEPQGNQVLDQILAAIREGNSKDAGDLIDSAAKPKVEPVAPTPVDPVSTDGAYKPTGNAVLDVAVETFIAMTGATESDINRALQYAVEAGGDARLIDKAFLKERFGDNAERAQKLAEAVLQQNQTQAAGILQAVYDTAGGEDNFKTAAELFRTNAKPGMVKVVKQMLDSGDADTVKEAASLIVEFGKQSGALVKPGQRQVATSGFNAAAGISAEEFTQARQKLDQYSRTYHQDYARLMDLRRIGKQLGK